MVCTVNNTTLSGLHNAFKCHSIEIWTPPGAQGVFASCSVQWATVALGSQQEVSDSTVSVAEPAHVKAVPPRDSSAGMWNTISTALYATLIAPTGSVIDVDVTHTQQDNNAVGDTIAAASCSLGVMYYACLDGVAEQYTPVSLNNTT